MNPIAPELAEKLAGYLVNRRDKRVITFSVLALYAAGLLYHFIGPALGAPEQKTALDSIETLATVVVVAHIAGGAAQRAVAQRALAPPALRGPAYGERKSVTPALEGPAYGERKSVRPRKPAAEGSRP